MPWNVLSSYGEGDGGFLDEGEQPNPADSLYERKTENGQNKEGNHVTLHQENGQVSQG